MKHKHIQAFSYHSDEVDLLLYEAITEESARSFLGEFRYVEAAGIKNINVRLNCSGGSVTHGYGIVAAMLSPTSATITTYNDGVCASMGAFIFLCGHKRVMKDYSTLMFHQASYPPDVEVTENDTIALASYNASLTKLMAERMGLSEAQVQQAYLKPGKDTWVTAAQAKTQQLADTIEVTARAGIQADTTRSLLEIQAYYQQFIPTNEMKRELIIAAFNLPETATDADILAKINERKQLAGDLAQARADLANITAELASEKEKVKTYEQQAAEMQEARVQKLVADAVVAKKIAPTEEVKKNWMDLARANYEQVEKALASMSAHTLLSSGIQATTAKTAATGNEPSKILSFSEKMAQIRAKNGYT